MIFTLLIQYSSFVFAAKNYFTAHYTVLLLFWQKSYDYDR